MRRNKVIQAFVSIKKLVLLTLLCSLGHLINEVDEAFEGAKIAVLNCLTQWVSENAFAGTKKAMQCHEAMKPLRIPTAGIYIPSSESEAEASAICFSKGRQRLLIAYLVESVKLACSFIILVTHGGVVLASRTLKLQCLNKQEQAGIGSTRQGCRALLFARRLSLTI
ncbi:hypothetical protein N431DRAFT_456333 [Stipitochalara longipes BDJ]|nr:hypothetical protein N431DRAFT_456333 [Stipitochalara longipes BDJ]